MRTAFAFAVFLMFAPAATITAADTVRYSLDASAMEERGRLTHLQYDAHSRAIRLENRVLIEDDAPGNGPPEGTDTKQRPWFEKLHRGIRIRKTLVLDDPRAFSGWLVMDGSEREHNTEPLHISVNGTHVVRPATQYAYPRAEHYYLINENNYFTDNWFIIPIPVGALHAGNNDIELWTESEESSWEVVVAADKEFARGSETRTHHPNRSAKSRDNGRTWDDRRLGWTDAYDGEYAIRLSLDRYQAAGEYESPVFDLAEPPGPEGIKRLLSVTGATLAWDVDIPPETAAEVAVRFGDTALPDQLGWTAYRTVDGDSLLIDGPVGRFCRFRVRFSTANPLATPAFARVRVAADVELAPTESPIVCTLRDIVNGQVIEPSYPFIHEDFAALADFRKKFRLDEIVAGARTEFEAQLRILRWAYQVPIIPMTGYNWDPMLLPKFSADENGNQILQEEYPGRRRDLHCLMSNFTLMNAFLSLGWPARYVNLQTEGRMHAHEVTEVWSNDFNKWVFMDATRDFYIYDPQSGVPLSLVEVSGRLAAAVPDGVADWYDPIWLQIPDLSRLYKLNVAFREGNNRFSIRDVLHGPNIMMLMGQLHMVMRNDFASRPNLVPWRVTGHWGGDQYMGWYSDTFPVKREYGTITNRRQDFDMPLNQAELTVLETDRPGMLRVDIATDTPCFDCYEVRVDNAEWDELRTNSLTWDLHAGINTCRVRTRNSVGVTGPESRVEIVMND